MGNKPLFKCLRCQKEFTLSDEHPQEGIYCPVCDPSKVCPIPATQDKRSLPGNIDIRDVRRNIVVRLQYICMECYPDYPKMSLVDIEVKGAKFKSVVVRHTLFGKNTRLDDPPVCPQCERSEDMALVKVGLDKHPEQSKFFDVDYNPETRQ